MFSIPCRVKSIKSGVTTQRGVYHSRRIKIATVLRFNCIIMCSLVHLYWRISLEVNEVYIEVYIVYAMEHMVRTPTC